MQIIVHTLMIEVAYPASVIVFFGQLIEVINFQIYDFGNFYNRVFALDPESQGNQPLTDLFDNLGYQSLFIIQNFGTLCWTLLITPAVWACSTFLAKISRQKFSRFRNKWSNIMFFNGWISIIKDTYLFLAVCVCLNSYYLRWNSFGEIFNSVLALTFGAALVLYSTLLPVFYNTKSSQLAIQTRDQSFNEKYGSALVGLNYKREGTKVLIYCSVVAIRKMWLALIVVF